MTQYFTDFSEYATGSFPADWTSRYEVFSSGTVETLAGATGGQVFQLFGAGSANIRDGVSWDGPSTDEDRADAEIVARYRFITNPRDLGLMARASGTTGSSVNMYLGRDRPNTPLKSIDKYVSGSFTSLAGTSAANDAGQWYWIRFRVNGTSLKVRFWDDGDAEPASWTHETTDSSLSGPGWIGMFRFNGAGGVYVDVFGVGTGGDAAPKSAGSDETELDPVAASHAHAAMVATLAQVHDVLPENAVQTHAASAVLLSQSATVVLENTRHGHAVSGVSLGTGHLLAIDAAGHGHRADAAIIAAGGQLVILSCRHGHACEDAEHLQIHILAAFNTIHAHAALMTGVSQAGMRAPDQRTLVAVHTSRLVPARTSVFIKPER